MDSAILAIRMSRVSWWGKSFAVPTSATGQRVKLEFTEGIRQRAEIYVNQQLVGYELVHQTPFEVDVTNAVNIGGINTLAVRITDPNGTFSWGESVPIKSAGNPGNCLPLSGYLFPLLPSGFGGILGKVELQIENPVHVSDIFVQNLPSLTDINTGISIANDGSQTVTGIPRSATDRGGTWKAQFSGALVLQTVSHGPRRQFHRPTRADDSGKLIGVGSPGVALEHSGRESL